MPPVLGQDSATSSPYRVQGRAYRLALDDRLMRKKAAEAETTALVDDMAESAKTTDKRWQTMTASSRPRPISWVNRAP